MKMEKNTENLIKNRKAALILVLACTLAVAAGCGKKTDEVTEPTTPSTTVTKEETTPEVVEPTESTPVETTETVPETEDVESIDLSQYSNAVDCINALQAYDDLLIIVWNNDNGGQTILKDGDHFETSTSSSSSLFFNRTPENVKNAVLECNNNNAKIMESKKGYGLMTVIGEDVEYKATFTYNDGTEETITVYITEELAE